MSTITGGPSRGVRLPRNERRAQLLASALEVFVENGYHATGMDDIADRAGVSKPVLYQHFPGKLDLYLALIDTGIDEMLTHIHTALESTTDNKHRVTATVDAYFSFVEDRAGYYRLLFENDLTNEPVVAERLERLTELCAREVSTIIGEDTGLPDEESFLLAVGLVGIAQVTARFWLRSGGSIPRATAAELVATLEWRGIRGFPKRDA